MKELYDKNPCEEAIKKDLINIVKKYTETLRGIKLCEDDIANVADGLTESFYDLIDDFTSEAMGV